MQTTNTNTGCVFPLCKFNQDKGSDFCLHHRKHFGAPDIKEKKAIPKKSAKRKEEDKEYKKIVKELLAENPNCQIKETGCTTKASGLHHQKKRTPSTLLDKRYLIRACNNCNLWAELNPMEAIKKGHSHSKFKK